MRRTGGLRPVGDWIANRFEIFAIHPGGMGVVYVAHDRLGPDGRQTFQSVADQCHDHHVKALRRVAVRVEGLGKDAAKDARSLGLAIPQMGKADVTLDQLRQRFWSP